MTAFAIICGSWIIGLFINRGLNRIAKAIEAAHQIGAAMTTPTREEIDTIWQQALQESVKAGEQFTRYHFAALVSAAEREACAKRLDELGCDHCAAAIRARSNT